MNRLRNPTPLSFPAICIQTCVLNNLFEVNKPFAKTTPFPTQPLTHEWLQRETEGHSLFSELVILVNSLSHKIIRKKMRRRVFSSRTDMTGLSLVCGQRQCFPDTADSKAFNPSQEANTLACQFLQRCLTQKHLDTPGSPWTRACSSAMLFTVRARSS